MQIQAVDVDQILPNVPVVSDTPWAVQGSHRNDFGSSSTTHFCVVVAPQECILPPDDADSFDFRSCTTRCWGYNATSPVHAHTTEPFPPQQPDPFEEERNSTVAWTVDPNPLAQGDVKLLVGLPGEPGREDGKLREPHDVAVDHQGFVWVADTGNHCIRRVSADTGTSITIAGKCGFAGHEDGLGFEASFNWPTGIDVYDIQGGSQGIVAVVSDTNNHRIRQIRWEDLTNASSAVVTTLAGGRRLAPLAGYIDGDAIDARFNFPQGLAADYDGTVYVADTANHLIRRILTNGTTSTVAGNTVPKRVDSESPCPPPCLEGMAGFRDGNVSFARFQFPARLAISTTGSLLVTEQHRVREIVNGHVHTISGQQSPAVGFVDGHASEATFNSPTGVVVTREAETYVVDAVSCRVRRLAALSVIAKDVACGDTLATVLRPGGCASYEPPVDEMNLMGTDVSGNVHYGYTQRKRIQKLNGWVIANRSFVGRTIKRCQGSPPQTSGNYSNGDTLGPTRDTAHSVFTDDEDTGQGTAIYVKCPTGCSADPAQVIGNASYAELSSICRSAIHLGELTDAGGVIRVLIEGESSLPAATEHGITSITSSGNVSRTFIVEQVDADELYVQTVAGAPAAMLSSGCGYSGKQSIPQAARFQLPRGVALARNGSLAEGGKMYIADTMNHVVRSVSATCSMVCENGGRCVSSETCECATGWTGFDCTTPVCSDGCSSTGSKRTLCVAPDTCACVPGYTNFPSCDTPLCVQSCSNGGQCTAPDTCTCASGWYDSNCTTPICSQTCGNGAECTAPDTCSCASGWSGTNCRTPVCVQNCQNGGHCIAPDTCECMPEWSGHDCSMPVCTQGYFRSEPVDAAKDDLALRDVANWTYNEVAGSEWRQYVPCDVDNWCRETNGFDCGQVARQLNNDEFAEGPCVLLELMLTASTPFSYELANESGAVSPFYRVQAPLPYSWNAWMPGPYTKADLITGINGWATATAASSDRIVAVTQLRRVPQGRYVCANGGNCTAPDTCKCASGWIGFDCRIPVCEQGFFVDNDGGGRVPLHDNLGNVQSVDEAYEGQGMYECSIRSVTEWENPEYIHDHPNYYSRYMDHHPEAWSSSSRNQIHPEDPYYWDNMSWPHTHEHTEPDGNHTTRGWTRNGYWIKANGARWTKGKCTVEFARHCESDASKAMDVRTLFYPATVENTDVAFRAIVYHTDKRTLSIGRWRTSGGECIDHVVRGCYNNGTCVAPNTCVCAEGWTGPDCSVPVCTQTCSRDADEVPEIDSNNLPRFTKGTGNCTLPDTCTCEVGWSGTDCSTPLCAQECNNLGKCTGPDQCTCPRWRSSWTDHRLGGGYPLFRDDSGDAQLTGWTGYDCATPICTQAERFVVNENRVGQIRLGGYGLILAGQEPYNNIRRPDLRSPPYSPFTLSDDFPPVQVFLPSLRDYNKAIWAASGPQMLESDYRLCRKFGFRYCTLFPNAEPYLPLWGLGDGEVTRNDGRSFQSGCKQTSARFSDFDDIDESNPQLGFLCEVDAWLQGDYAAGRYERVNQDSTGYEAGVNEDAFNWLQIEDIQAGEGIYQCYNYGSCVAPEECTCPDGFTGFDCSTPLCRHKQVDGQIVSCLNDGECSAKDHCQCKQAESLVVPGTTTGWTGTDCTIPICAQGTFDPTCDGITAGGEGCYRCHNGGICTAPDLCTCTEEWTGVDCATPVCAVRADAAIVTQLDTQDMAKVLAFEKDPCGTTKTNAWNGLLLGRGNCTAPNVCTCLCMDREYPVNGKFEREPWKDLFDRPISPGYTFGTLNCISGFEGKKNSQTSLFTTCHLQIYEPSWFERNTLLLIFISSGVVLVLLIIYILVRRHLRRQFLLALEESNEIEAEVPLKRKSRKSRKSAGSTRKKTRFTSRKAI